MATSGGSIRRFTLPVIVVLLIIAALVFFFWPATVPVDLTTVQRGPLEVTVEEEGQTRVKDRYTISAPLAGNLLRVELDPGDPVREGQVIAWIAPRVSDPLDPRAFAEAQARVEAASANVRQARAVVERQRAELERAVRDLQRVRALVAEGAATQRELDDAITVERIAQQNFAAAQFAQQMAEYELQAAEAAAQRLSPQVMQDDPQALFEVRSPSDGQVLRVMQESEAVVTPGTPIMEVGDPAKLEVEVDVLSRDAVRIVPGARVELDRWGGEQPLPGHVRLVEPSGFTKISALGVEEQRVFVIVDFDDPPAERGALGDAYRVIARVVTWEDDDVLLVPVGALFRSGDRWAVFRAVEGRAQLQFVEVGHMSTTAAEVLAGLEEGDRVVLHPSDRISPGVRITPRDEEY